MPDQATLLKRIGIGVGLLVLCFACGLFAYRDDLFPPEEKRIKAGVQETLNILAQAHNENRPELLDQIVDPQNPAFKEVVQMLLKNYETSFFNERITYKFTATTFEKKGQGYVLMNVRMNSFWAAYWYFREENGRWLLSEPTRAQLGDPLQAETEHFRIQYYAWSSDILPIITDTLEVAYTNTVDKLAQAPTEKAFVEIVPLSELVTLRYHSAIGVYIPDADSASPTGKIMIISPYAYAAQPYWFGHGWKPDLIKLLTHEYTHLVHHQIYAFQGAEINWLTEGLAEYVVGDLDSINTTCYAVDRNFSIPVWDATTPKSPQDLVHLSTLSENRALGYGLAHLLVEHVVETYGGLPALWELGEAYDETGDFEEALISAFDVSYAEFDREWQAWLKDRC